MDTRTISLCFLSILTVFHLTSCDNSQETPSEARPSFFDQLSHQELTTIQLRTDLGKLQADLKSDVFQPATLTWTDPAGKRRNIGARLRIRGNSRRNFCSFPPLKLKFSKKALSEHGLAAFNDLKLVTHCIEDERYVLREYLGYRLFRLLSENSFRVQLLRVQYLDEKGATPAMEKYGFLIEDEQEMASRLEGKLISPAEGLNVMDAGQYRLLTVFQFMIGNTDWALSNGHNVKLVAKASPESAPVIVPYDFDSSGMVNAPYAKPYPTLPIDSVRQRFFQWRSKNRKGLEETLGFFNDHRQAIIQACQDFTLLDEHSRQDITAYLESFFAILNDPLQKQEKFFSSQSDQ